MIQSTLHLTHNQRLSHSWVGSWRRPHRRLRLHPAIAWRGLTGAAQRDSGAHGHYLLAWFLVDVVRLEKSQGNKDEGPSSDSGAGPGLIPWRRVLWNGPNAATSSGSCSEPYRTSIILFFSITY